MTAAVTVQARIKRYTGNGRVSVIGDRAESGTGTQEPRLGSMIKNLQTSRHKAISMLQYRLMFKTTTS